MRIERIKTFRWLFNTEINMKNIGKIYIIIPVHNRVDFTKDCLASLEKQTYGQFMTVVVDDGSTDGTSEMVRSQFPEVEVLNGDGSLWWTGGINLGIEFALKQGADYVLTLNDDTILPDNFVEKMVFWASEKPEALFGALEKDYGSKEIMYAGQLAPSWAKDQANYLLKDQKSANLAGIQAVKIYHGRGLWIPAPVFESIGLFDTKRFPHYMADFDFTLSASEAGFRIFCNFDAVVYSFPEASGESIIKKKRSINTFHKHLFDVRGGGNLVNFTRFTFKHCPIHLIPPRLLVGYSRRLLGFWLN